LLEREALVEVWYDLQIKPGDTWNDEIKRKLDEADIFLFLLSTHLLASNYVQDVELPIARKKHKDKTARIVPVVVSACSWTGSFGDIQGLPANLIPIKEWRDKDQAFHDVEKGLRETIEEVRKTVRFSTPSNHV
jgi:internalin A